ncbi:MAG: recombinase family protein, partial [Oscillospiraceae bacterium]
EAPPQESESIQNQKSMLVQYAVEQGWEIYSIFCDEDYSGADRERPAFQRLLCDAEQRKFDIVLCKTQSRFTRDMELVETYLHGRFPEWGIRFVAMVDHTDTAVKGSKKARQINGLINEWYLEDLSENIRSVLDYKRRSGQYIGGFPVYGYQKAPGDKNKLILDPEAAEVVRRIYQLYLSGNGKQHIAALLNEAGIPNPTKHKQELGWSYVNGAQVNDFGLWSRTSVGRILRDQMYTGDLVQGRTKKVSYKSKRMIAVPESDWIIAPDTHEAIIDRETFATVRRLLGERTRSDGTGEVHSLAGKVKCMDCGSTLAKYAHSANGAHHAYLRCKLYATDKSRCTKHIIRLDLLEEQVLLLLRQFFRQSCDASRAGTLFSGNRRQPAGSALEREIKSLSVEAERRSKALRDLYLDKSRGLLDEAQFWELNRG